MSYCLTEGAQEVYSYMRKEKEVGENFTVKTFIVCTHQLIWLGQLNQGGQIGRAGSLHGKMTNSCTLVSCVKGGYIIEGVITLIWILTEVGHEYVIWIEVVQKRVHWLAFVSMMLNL
jgi:hypothetical protein